MKMLVESEGVDYIIAATREVPTQLSINPTQYLPRKNFMKVPHYQRESFMVEEINEEYGLGVMQPGAANGLATPILEEVQEMPNEVIAIIIATVKCVAPACAVEEIEQVAPADLLDCNTVMAIDVAGRVRL